MSGQAPVDESGAKGYLHRFGYLDQPTTSRDEIAAALLHFQERFGLALTGKLDTATAAAMAEPRCGVSDETARGLGDPWQKTVLTWAFGSMTEKLAPWRHTANAMLWAFRHWQNVTPLRFKRVELEDSPDMIVRFERGAHGDSSPFDGPRGVLAHAFFPPPNPAGDEIAGDIHFDEDEAWTVRNPKDANEFDLVTVAIHEIGHALGLGHSFEAGDIMFPTVGGVQRHLSTNDVRNIHRLYGDPHDGNGTPVAEHGNGNHTIWFSAPDELDLFVTTPVNGRMHRRHAAGMWGPRRELGGEYDPKFTLNQEAVPTGNASDAILFARSYQSEIYAQHIGPQDGPLRYLGGRRAPGLFAAGMAGTPTVFRQSPVLDPSTPVGEPVNDSFLLERSFDGVAMTDWALVFDGVSPLRPGVATRSDQSATLVLADRAGQLWAADGVAGNWSAFDALPPLPALRHTTLHRISACCPTDTAVDVTVTTVDSELLYTRRTASGWDEWLSFGNAWGWARLVTDGQGTVHLVANQYRGTASRTVRRGTRPWEPWQSLGDRRFDREAVAAQPGRLDLILHRPRGMGRTHHSFVV